MLLHKRQMVVVLLTALFTMLTSACQKDGVYKPEKKLSKIHLETDYWQRDMIWNWDGNLLNSIKVNYSDDYSDVFEFEYQGQRVKTIICSDISGYKPVKYYHFHYNGRHLSCIEGVQDTNNEEFPQRPCAKYTFTHNDRDQITEIQVELYGENKSADDPLTEILSMVLPGLSLTDAERIYQTQTEMPAPKEFYKRVITLAYEGDNVKEYRIDDDNKEYVYLFQYTDYPNPMYRFFSGNYTDLFMPFTFSYSRNLPSSADIQYYHEWAGSTDVLNYHNEYHYQLDEDGYVTDSQYIGNEENGIVVTCRYEYVK